MITNPRPGTPCQIWYRKGLRDSMPFHGFLCSVLVPGRGRPRNHLVRTRGTDTEVVVPAGNLRKEP